jgi:hypothetical protein
MNILFTQSDDIIVPLFKESIGVMSVYQYFWLDGSLHRNFLKCYEYIQTQKFNYETKKWLNSAKISLFTFDFVSNPKAIEDLLKNEHSSKELVKNLQELNEIMQQKDTHLSSSYKILRNISNYKHNILHDTNNLLRMNQQLLELILESKNLSKQIEALSTLSGLYHFLGNPNTYNNKIAHSLNICANIYSRYVDSAFKCLPITSYNLDKLKAQFKFLSKMYINGVDEDGADRILFPLGYHNQKYGYIIYDTHNNNAFRCFSKKPLHPPDLNYLFCAHTEEDERFISISLMRMDDLQ